MEKMTLSDIFRMIGKDCYFYYRPKTNEVNTLQYYYLQEDQNNENLFDEEIGSGISSELIPLPRYEDIDHKNIMSFFVREFVEDKEMRRKLFNILRNHDFMDKFLAAVKELELYEEYIMVTDDIYIQLAEEWFEENGCERADIL
ncbi:MAG: hypothetical protein FWG88_09090 [Oscillospiraceae bacterium]|nr:hypothetical protein [Oscillospiraceae bacterium]